MEFSKRVLIVDDEPSVVGVLLDFFARFQHGHAYDVVTAYSAAEALIAGAVGYLHKPFSLRELDCSVALALGPRAASG